jgi:ketosteroid isomerase-like protein
VVDTVEGDPRRRPGRVESATVPADEHPDVAAIRRFYVAFSRGDVAAAQAVFAADALWHVPGRSLIAGDHRGWDAIAQNFLNRLRELSNGTFRVELLDVLLGGSWAAALQHATATRRQKHLDITVCQLMRLQDGKITEVRGYYSDQYALDEFWS